MYAHGLFLQRRGLARCVGGRASINLTHSLMAPNRSVVTLVIVS